MKFCGSHGFGLVKCQVLRRKQYVILLLTFHAFHRPLSRLRVSHSILLLACFFSSLAAQLAAADFAEDSHIPPYPTSSVTYAFLHSQFTFLRCYFCQFCYIKRTK
jgi:hypothetical protein